MDKLWEEKGLTDETMDFPVVPLKLKKGARQECH
jgi:hypothetical protein